MEPNLGRCRTTVQISLCMDNQPYLVYCSVEKKQQIM